MKASKKIYVFIFIGIILTSILSCGKVTKEEHYKKGVEYGVEGEFGSAKLEFEKALELDSLLTYARVGLKIVEDVFDEKINKQTAIHLFKGKDFRNKGELPDVISEISKALEIDSNYALAFKERGYLYCYLGSYDLAISDCNKVLEINPEEIYAYFGKAIALEESGRFKEAVKAYKKFIQKATSNYKTDINAVEYALQQIEKIENRRIFK